MSPVYRLLTLVPLILLGMPLFTPLEQACAEYVRNEEVQLRMDKGEYTTSLPLDPSHEYRVQIRSPYTLRPLLNHVGPCHTHKDERRFFSETVLVCRFPVLVNGVLAPMVSQFSPESYNRAQAAYFIDPDTLNYFVPKLSLVVWGTGHPLSL